MNYLFEIARLNKTVNKYQKQIQALEQKPFGKLRNRKQIAIIQALEEGARDILTTTVTQAQNVAGVVDKNNYKTYSSQVHMTYEMYNGRSDYGSEVLRGVIDTRVAFIGGEGINVNAEKDSTKKFIEKFMDFNKLHGSRLITMLQTGEMEGKDLALLLPSKNDRQIKVRSFSWWLNNYNIITDKQDTDLIKRISYRPKKEDTEEKIIPIDQAVYVKLGGSEDRIIETPSRIHTVLTDIENYSRAKYDMRKNSHLFERITPTWEVETQAQATAINNDVESGSFEIGKGYAGTGKMGLLEPSGRATEALIKDMLISLKNVSMTTSIPIHWLAWPELMSNRATAENLLEVVNAGTVKERLIWQEAFKLIIQKSMILAIDQGFEKNDILGDFQVQLPLISFATLKALQETWIPLEQGGYVSMATARNHIPSIDPIEEEKLIEQEKEKAAEESPLNNNILEDTLNNLQGE